MTWYSWVAIGFWTFVLLIFARHLWLDLRDEYRLWDTDRPVHKLRSLTIIVRLYR